MSSSPTRSSALKPSFMMEWLGATKALANRICAITTQGGKLPTRHAYRFSIIEDEVIQREVEEVVIPEELVESFLKSKPAIKAVQVLASSKELHNHWELKIPPHRNVSKRQYYAVARRICEGYAESLTSDLTPDILCDRSAVLNTIQRHFSTLEFRSLPLLAEVFAPLSFVQIGIPVVELSKEVQICQRPKEDVETWLQAMGWAQSANNEIHKLQSGFLRHDLRWYHDPKFFVQKSFVRIHYHVNDTTKLHPFGGDFLHLSSEVMPAIYRSIRLFCDGSIILGPRFGESSTIRNPGQRGWWGEDYIYHTIKYHLLDRTNSIKDSTEPKFVRSILDSDQLNTFKKLFRAVLAWNSPRFRYLRVATERFISATQDDSWQFSPDSSLLDMVISLEAIFLLPASQLAQRVARFVGNDTKESNKIRDVVKTAYRLRSRIVHGGDYYVRRGSILVDENDSRVDTDKYLDLMPELTKIVRESLCRFWIEKIDSDARSVLIRKLDNI